MTGKELRRLVMSGKKVLVEFTDYIEDQECRFEKGMKAYVYDVSLLKGGDMVIIQFEEREYRDFNRTLEKARFQTNIQNVFDKWSDSPYRTDDKGREFIYEMENEEIQLFDIVGDASQQLYQKFLEEGSNYSYIDWLEMLVMNFRNNRINKVI